MNDRWSKTIMVLHWLSAAFVVTLVSVGFLMVDLPADAPLRRVMGRAHALGGITLGVLTIVRLLRRFFGTNPAPIPLAPLHRKGASFIHGLLYFSLFAMVASGLATALGSDWHSFVSGDVPTAPDLEASLPRQVHGALALIVLLLVAAHVGGVLMHELRRGGALRRMLPFLR